MGDNWIWLKGNIDKGFLTASFNALFEFVVDLELNDKLSTIFREKTKIHLMWLSKWGEPREGLAKFYYSNYNLAVTGNYKAGKKEGIWEFYDEDGKLAKKVSYVNDVTEEEVVY